MAVSDSSASDSSAPGWVLVVPVKRLDQAKTRLGARFGGGRRELALAFAADTVTAALRAAPVRAVVVVTDVPEAARALTELGADVVADAPAAGLNPALRHGANVAARRFPGCGTGALSADLPALRPDELDRALLRAAQLTGERQHAFVRDAAGTGTTVVLSRVGSPLAPAFGPDSAAAHLAAGHVEIAGDDLPSVRHDVDTPDDLEAALRLGVGPHTAALLSELADV